jgi:hypothetical protein
MQPKLLLVFVYAIFLAPVVRAHLTRSQKDINLIIPISFLANS